MSESPVVLGVEYHAIRIIHKDPDKTANVIAVFPDEAEPAKQPGMIYIRADVPPVDRKHNALGRFMDTYSKLEMMIRNKIIDMVLSCESQIGRIIAYSNSGKAMADLLQNLSDFSLQNSADRHKYAKLCERFNRLNTKRNHLVHGYWALEILVCSRPGGAYLDVYEQREYPPPNAKRRADLNSLSNQNIRSRYLFTLAAIKKAEEDIASLYSDFVKFHNEKLTLKFDPALVVAQAHQVLGRFPGSA